MADGRHFMNPAYGESLARAREAEDKEKKEHKPGSVRRVTIEPKGDGKHHIIVEHNTTVIAGKPEGGNLKEHDADSGEDAANFVRSVLGGTDPDEARDKKDGIRGPSQSGGPKEAIDEDSAAGSGEDAGDGGFLNKILSGMGSK